MDQDNNVIGSAPFVYSKKPTDTVSSSHKKRVKLRRKSWKSSGKNLQALSGVDN